MASDSRQVFRTLNILLILVIIAIAWYLFTDGGATLKPRTGQATPDAPASPPVTMGNNNSVESLKAQLEQEKMRIERARASMLAREQAQAPATSAAPATGSLAGGLEIEEQKRLIEAMIAAQLKNSHDENQRLATALAKKNREIEAVKQQNEALAKRLITLDKSTQTLLTRLIRDGNQISSSDQDYIGALNAPAAPAPTTANGADLINRVEISDKNDGGSVDAQLHSLVGTLMAEDNKPVENRFEPAKPVAPTTDMNALQASVDAVMARSDERQREQQFNKDEQYFESLANEEKERSNETRWVTVRPGDTLYKIAQRAYNNGDLYYKIFKANPQVLKNPDKIKQGQRLRVPL